jgi:hypothetical protein
MSCCRLTNEELVFCRLINEELVFCRLTNEELLFCRLTNEELVFCRLTNEELLFCRLTNEELVFCRLTNEDGRASGFLSWEDFHVGTYKMHFATGAYFAATGRTSFYPFAEVRIGLL